MATYLPTSPNASRNVEPPTTVGGAIDDADGHHARVRAPLARALTFAGIGGGSTVLYLLLYLALAPALRPQGANAVALLLSTVANTAANRRFTFGVRGRNALAAHHSAGLAVFGLGLAFTSAALALLHLATDPGRMAEIAALVGANLVVTVLRFLALRWIFSNTDRAVDSGRALSRTDRTPTPAEDF